MSDLPRAPDEGPGGRPDGEARNYGALPAWLGGLSLCVALPIGIVDYFAAANGSPDFVLGATVIGLVALIIAGCSRLIRVGTSMIMAGLAYLVLAAVVIGWDEVLAGVAMLVTGAVAVMFGAAIVGPRTIAARAWRLAQWATKARRA